MITSFALLVFCKFVFLTYLLCDCVPLKLIQLFNALKFCGVPLMAYFRDFIAKYFDLSLKNRNAEVALFVKADV